MGLEEIDLKKAYLLFKDKISYKEFLQRLNAFDENKKWNFVRACLRKLSAEKVGEIDKNIKNLLLCISIEAISNDNSKNISFKDWLVTHLNGLENKNKVQLKKELDIIYNDYINFEEREGILFNFKKFIKEYCSKELQDQKIISFANFEDYEDKEYTGFDFALDYIYSKFRSLFTHRGIGRIETSKDLGIFDNETIVISDTMLDKHKNKPVHIDLTKVLDWFEQVVESTLFNYLIERKNGKRRKD